MARITKRTQARAASMERGALRSVTTRDGKTRVKDSFQNFALNLGIGTDNALSGSTYGFNPITRNRTLLEWMHRGSWVAGMAVDVVAEDMTREGVDVLCDAKPEDIDKIQTCLVSSGTWSGLQDTVKWSRLYGGAIGVISIDGQDESTPLNVDRVGRGQFRGVYALDRWMVDPSLNDLVSEKGPHLGLPKFYRASSDVSGFRFSRPIHYSRVVRLIGVQLPYWQAVSENLWGISVLERLYDRMVAFDSATTGAAQLSYKAHLRTYKIKGMREILGAGGQAQALLQMQVQIMRRFQSNEGITVIDAEDEYEADASMSMTGIAEALLQFGQQLSGALQIPLVRMFGQSPAGLNSTGESDLRTYYDGISQKQKRDLHEGVTKIVRCAARSEGVALPQEAAVQFRPLWQLSEEQKSEVASRDALSVRDMEDAGLITQQTALRELKTLSKVTGRFTNVTDEDVEAAADELPPRGQEALEQEQEAMQSRADTLSETDGEQPKPQPGKTKDVTLYKWRVTYALNGDKSNIRSIVLRAGPKEEDAKRAYGRSSNALDLYIRAERLEIVRDTASPRLSSRDSLPISQFAGLDVAIECAAGTRRWNGGPVYDADYGYVRRAPSAEGPQEWLDCFVGPLRDETADAYVIDGFRPRDGAFDEHKVMLGYLDKTAAVGQWRQAYASHLEMGACTRMSIDALRAWIATGDVTRPIVDRRAT